MNVAQLLFLAKTNNAVWLVVFVPLILAIWIARSRKKDGR